MGRDKSASRLMPCLPKIHRRKIALEKKKGFTSCGQCTDISTKQRAFVQSVLNYCCCYCTYISNKHKPEVHGGSVRYVMCVGLCSLVFLAHPCTLDAAVSHQASTHPAKCLISRACQAWRTYYMKISSTREGSNSWFSACESRTLSLCHPATLFSHGGNLAQRL